MYSIAVIEDNPADVLALKIALQGANVHHETWLVLEEEAGTDALFCRPKAPDMIVMDAMLPGHFSGPLITQIKMSPALKHVPIIVLSGVGNPRIIQRLLDLGATEFCPKPFSLDGWRSVGEQLKRTLLSTRPNPRIDPNNE